MKMKKNKLNKCILFMIILTYMCTVVGCITPTRSVEKDEYISLQLLMVDSDNEILRNTIEVESNSDQFRNNVSIAHDNNIDKEFDVILLCNYKQVSFSINDLKPAKVQGILLNKTSDLVRNVFELSFNGISPGINDCILILNEKISKENDSHLVFTMRFSVLCNEYSSIKHLDFAINNTDLTVENSINDKIFFNDLVILDSNLQELKSFNETSSQSSYIIIDLESNILQTNFSDGYLNDKSYTNNMINIGVFAVGDNNQLIEMDQRNVHLIQSQLDDKIIAEIDLSNIPKDFKKISFFAVAYPFESQNDKAGTYKRVFWNTILSTSYYCY